MPAISILSSAHSSSVGNQSTACMMASCSTPLQRARSLLSPPLALALALAPSPQTSAGTRTPPSHALDLPPRKGRFNPPEEVLPPLSLEKIMSVEGEGEGEGEGEDASSSSMPRRRSASSTVAMPSSRPATRPQKERRHGRRTWSQAGRWYLAGALEVKG